MIKKFTDLKIYQLTHKLTLEICKLTLNFPTDEKFGMTSQIRRSASSIPANIVKGFPRHSTKKFIQFLYQVGSSLSETIYFLILAKNLNFLKENVSSDLEEQNSVLAEQINALIKSLKSKND